MDKKQRWQALFLQNPVTVKELRSRMRGRRAFVILTVYLLVMSSFISLIYLAYASAANNPYGPDPGQAGKVIFGAVLGIQVFLVVFIGPAFTAGAISGEKERQTYDLLRTTLLSAEAFVAGKLLSALSYVFLLILAAIPLMSIAFLLGGVSGVELVISQLVIAVAAIAFAMYGLLCSSFMRTTLGASVTTFAGALFVIAGIPLIVLMFGIALTPFFAGATVTRGLGEVLLVYGFLLLVATNLPGTLIASEVILLQENAIFLFQMTLSGYSIWVFSPWTLFVVLYTLLALLLYWLCVRRVRRIAEK